MADYEFQDAQGNRYRLIRGAGPGWHHANNLGRGSSMVAEQLLGSVADAIVYKAYDHFYFDVLSALPDASPLPREALSEAIASSHLVLERLDSALAIGDEEPDPRQMLRVRIQSALFNIIAGERAEAAMHERMLSQESAVTKVAIYTGAFMTGIGSSAWGLALWAKEVSDVVNPVVRIHNNIKAIRAAWDSENFAEAYSSNILSAEKRELVEALGFDPTAINAQQIDEAIAMSDLVMSDESLRDMLYRFVKDYAEAQHSIEITEVAGSGAFEIILTIILAAVTGGAGVLAMVGSKAALIRKFRAVGDLLGEFAQASKKIALRNSKRGAKQEKASFKDLETSEGRSEKTDAHGAETGEVSVREDYGVAFFGEDNKGYYTREKATIGREGKTFFFMPLEDSAAVKTSADAAKHTGMAPSAQRAYMNDADIYGLSFPTTGKEITKPTLADSEGWPHYLEGGHTAVKTGDGPNAGYLVNSTREFVIPGGGAVPEGSVLFKLGSNGEWIPIRRF